MKVPFFWLELSSDEIEEVVDTLKKGWITTGPKTKMFEANFAEKIGAKHAVALNSCTAALHLALEAIHLRQGDCVIVPTMTFAATAEVVRYFDATPVMVDCLDDFNMDPDALERTIEDLLEGRPTAGLQPPYGRIAAIIPMHYAGNVCDMQRIIQIASKYVIPIIEDAAHAFPSWWRADEEAEWVHAGRHGQVGCFSFYSNKCITTGEGGMAVTDDDEIAERIRLMSLHGMNRNAWKRYTDQGSWFYEIVAPGFKYNLTDIAASLGIRQLEKADVFKKSREKVALHYSQAFSGHPALLIPEFDNQHRKHSWHIYSLRVLPDQLTINRDQFIEELKAREIFCSVHWMPLHLHPYYKQTYGFSENLFPVAESLWQQQITLPLFPTMTDEMMQYVSKSVLGIADQFIK